MYSSKHAISLLTHLVFHDLGHESVRVESGCRDNPDAVPETRAHDGKEAVYVEEWHDAQERFLLRFCMEWRNLVLQSFKSYNHRDTLPHLFSYFHS